MKSYFVLIWICFITYIWAAPIHLDPYLGSPLLFLGRSSAIELLEGTRDARQYINDLVEYQWHSYNNGLYPIGHFGNNAISYHPSYFRHDLQHYANHIHHNLPQRSFMGTHYPRPKTRTVIEHKTVPVVTINRIPKVVVRQIHRKIPVVKLTSRVIELPKRYKTFK